MIVYVKNKIMSLKGGSSAVDENGNELFKIDGKFFTVTNKKLILSLDGNVLFTVRNKFFHLLAKKALIYDGKTNQRICKVKEKAFSTRVAIVASDDRYEVESTGAFKAKLVYKNDVCIGSWVKCHGEVADFFRDGYRIETDHPEEAAFLVALVIAVDNIIDSRRHA